MKRWTLALLLGLFLAAPAGAAWLKDPVAGADACTPQVGKSCYWLVTDGTAISILNVHSCRVTSFHLYPAAGASLTVSLYGTLKDGSNDAGPLATLDGVAPAGIEDVVGIEAIEGTVSYSSGTAVLSAYCVGSAG